MPNLIEQIGHSAIFHLYHSLREGKGFLFRGQRLKYFHHRYNNTPETERIVEIPIALEFLRNAAGPVLEVGNVMNHYFPFPHTVVDKYERDQDVTNEDVIDFSPSEKFQTILSISTLEHVGWDEEPRDGTKALRSIARLCDMLAPGGRMLITVPIGFNPNIDHALRQNHLRASELVFMKRFNWLNEWREVPFNEVRDAQFGQPYRYANGLAVAYFRA